MASASIIEEIIDYYLNLLIIQYSGNQPKAQATIELFAAELFAEGIILDVMNAYNINPALGATAVGPQLDVIGKYVGVNRYYTNVNLVNYFALIPYSEATSPPASPPAFGASTYSNFNKFSYNGTLIYPDIITSSNALSDADFLTLIQFMVLSNNMNDSAAAIDNALYQIFGASVRAESGMNMSLAYFFVGPISTLLSVIIFKGLLPAPMGVTILIVQGIGNLLFGATTYAQARAGIYSTYAYGFSTYADYDTLPMQQTLTYGNISLQD